MEVVRLSEVQHDIRTLQLPAHLTVRQFPYIVFLHFGCSSIHALKDIQTTAMISQCPALAQSGEC